MSDEQLGEVALRAKLDAGLASFSAHVDDLREHIKETTSPLRHAVGEVSLKVQQVATSVSGTVDVIEDAGRSGLEVYSKHPFWCLALSFFGGALMVSGGPILGRGIFSTLPKLSRMARGLRFVTWALLR